MKKISLMVLIPFVLSISQTSHAADLDPATKADIRRVFIYKSALFLVACETFVQTVIYATWAGRNQALSGEVPPANKGKAENIAGLSIASNVFNGLALLTAGPLAVATMYDSKFLRMHHDRHASLVAFVEYFIAFDMIVLMSFQTAIGVQITQLRNDLFPVVSPRLEGNTYTLWLANTVLSAVTTVGAILVPIYGYQLVKHKPQTT